MIYTRGYRKKVQRRCMNFERLRWEEWKDANAPFSKCYYIVPPCAAWEEDYFKLQVGDTALDDLAEILGERRASMEAKSGGEYSTIIYFNKEEKSWILPLLRLHGFVGKKMSPIKTSEKEIRRFEEALGHKDFEKHFAPHTKRTMPVKANRKKRGRSR